MPQLHLFSLRAYFLFILLVSGIGWVGAQDRITGTVSDPSDAPVPYANVLLVSASDSSFVSGTTTDETGAFHLEIPADVSSLLQVASLGYQEKYVPVEPDHSHYDLVLAPSAFALDAVTVSGAKALYELKPDRMVMNVGATPALSGNTALQVLQRLPGVIVNQQAGSISMIGKGEVLLMINDKVQRVPRAVVLARLEGMRAENVERIELIHQPPARYDASGAAGIIHIVLKEQNDQGTNGTVSLTAGYGQREKAGLNLSLNSRKDNLNLYGDYNFNLNRSDRYQVDHFREYDYQGRFYYYENLFTLRNNRSRQHAASLGMDLNLGKRTTLGLLFNLIDADASWNDAPSISQRFVDGVPVDAFQFFTSGESQTTSALGNFNLFHELDESSNLNFDLDYVGIDFINSGAVRQSSVDTDPVLRLDRSTPVGIWTSSLDYTKNFTPKTQLQFGVKGTFSDISSETFVDNRFDNEWADDALFGGTDQITERILAAYTSFTTNITPRLTSETGLRFEKYEYRLDAANDEADLEQTFDNFFPILRFNYDLDSLYTLQLAYNRTITRPAFASLASIFVFLDPNTVVFSNPRLRPVFTHTIRFSVQRQAVVLSLAYLRGRNNLYNFNTVDKENQLQTSTPTNLDRSEILEANLTFPAHPAAWWEMNWQLGAMYQYVEDASGRPAAFTNDIVSYSLQLNSTFTLGNDWSASFDGTYRSPYLYGDQEFTLRPFFNAGIRKRFPGGATLSLSLQDLINTSGRIAWNYEQPEIGIRTFGLTDFSERQVRLTYSQPFGNQRVAQKRARTTGAEEVRNRM